MIFMILRGQVLEVEHKLGPFKRDPQSNAETQDREYDYFRVKLLDLDGFDVRSCRVGEHFGDLPAEGDEITARVRCSAYVPDGQPQGRRPRADLSVTLVAPVSVAAPAARAAV